MAGIDCANVLGQLCLQTMMPEEVKKRFGNDKHKILKLEDLRALFTRMINDHKNSKKKNK